MPCTSNYDLVLVFFYSRGVFLFFLEISGRGKTPTWSTFKNGGQKIPKMTPLFFCFFLPDSQGPKLCQDFVEGFALT